MSTPADGGYHQPQNLAEQLTVLDEFLRCGELLIATLLAKFLESRGSVHPASHANNLIDHLRIGGIGPTHWQRELPPVPIYENTRSSDHVCRTARNTNSRPSQGWNGCVTRTVR